MWRERVEFNYIQRKIGLKTRTKHPSLFDKSKVLSLFVTVNDRLRIYLCRCDTQSDEEKRQIQNVINNSYNELGPMKFKEVVAVIHFAMLALLWIARNPGGSGGWGSLFEKG